MHTLDHTLLLGGSLELEVPVLVRFRFTAEHRGSYYEPGHGPSAEVESVERCDGLAWHSGCQDALDAWWNREGECEAIASAMEDLESAAEEAAEARAEARRELAYLDR
jgi:hypothetical protein